MGNFYGGSTIIERGRFVSHDPADDGVAFGNRKNPPRGNQTITSRQKAFKSKQVNDPLKLLESARKSLLHTIIDQVLMGRDQIKIPRTIHPELQAALSEAGSPFAWAASQNEFGALEARKRKKREERDFKDNHGQLAGSVTVEVKHRKSTRKSDQSVALHKPIVSAEDIYQHQRMKLIRSIVGQMIKKQGIISVPSLNRQLCDEVKAAGSPLLWLQVQPEYPAVFKDLYLLHQKAVASVPKKAAQPPQKKKRGKKQRRISEIGETQGDSRKGNPKKKKGKQSSDPYEQPTRPVKPLSDAPVSFILKQLNKASEATFDVRKIDWDVT